MPESPDPYRDAVISILDQYLREELERAERQCELDLQEALAAKGRAHDHIRQEPCDRPFEVLEHELENEHQALIRYHTAKLAKRIRWILEAWKDRGDLDPA